MPKYCTWDGKRDRWVFQLRVPGNLREHFRGVAVIREHIGRVDGAVAAAHAQRRAGELRAQFDRLREAIRGSSSDTLIRPPLTRFTLGKALLPPSWPRGGRVNATSSKKHCVSCAVPKPTRGKTCSSNWQSNILQR